MPVNEVKSGSLLGKLCLTSLSTGAMETDNLCVGDEEVNDGTSTADNNDEY